MSDWRAYGDGTDRSFRMTSHVRTSMTTNGQDTTYRQTDYSSPRPKERKDRRSRYPSLSTDQRLAAQYVMRRDSTPQSKPAAPTTARPESTRPNLTAEQQYAANEQAIIAHALHDPDLAPTAKTTQYSSRARSPPPSAQPSWPGTDTRTTAKPSEATNQPSTVTKRTPYVKPEKVYKSKFDGDARRREARARKRKEQGIEPIVGLPKPCDGW